jgi:hypothetical protein
VTEAEALAIAVRAIVSAFVTPSVTHETQERSKAQAPSRRKKARQSRAAVAREPELFATEDILGDAPPVISVAEMEAMLGQRDPPGMYNPNDPEREGTSWLG